MDQTREKKETPIMEREQALEHTHEDCCCHTHSHSHGHSKQEEACCRQEHGHCRDHHHDHDDHGCSCGCGHQHGDRDEGDEKREIAKIVCSAILLLLGSFLPVDETVSFWLYLVAYVIVGFSVLKEAVENILHGQLFDENFLMAVASVGAICIGEAREAAMVMLLYSLGELLQDRAVDSSRRSIRSLMNVRPDRATLLENGQSREVEAESIPVGAVILVRPGEKVPLDGTVTEGTSLLDTSALTGESVPREVTVGDPALAGCLNQNGLLQIRVEKPFGESTASRILELVEHAGANKARSERFITRFARIYTPVVVLSAVALAVIPPLLGLGTWSVFIHKALNFLVISCPCALVISVPLAFFAGIGCASRNGILVKGGNYLEMLGKAEVAAFDKTGTLTQGKFSVVELQPASGVDEQELLHMAACAEAFSNHPLARSVLEAWGKSVREEHLTDAVETAGHGVCVTWNGHRILAGNSGYLHQEGVTFTSLETAATVIYVACDGSYQGAVLLADTVKADAKSGLDTLRTLGVRKTVMLTGDRRSVAQAVGAQVGIDEVRAELLPDEKLKELQALRSQVSEKGALLYAGDGINDAPVLANADVGVAMGGLGADAAMEAADVVIMSDEPSKIALGMRISQKTMTIARENIVFSIAVKLIILTLSIVMDIPLWLAVFADVGVCMLAILNTLRAMRI